MKKCKHKWIYDGEVESLSLNPEPVVDKIDFLVDGREEFIQRGVNYFPIMFLFHCEHCCNIKKIKRNDTKSLKQLFVKPEV